MSLCVERTRMHQTTLSSLSAKCDAKVAGEMFMGYQALSKESMLAVWLVCPTFLENALNLARNNLDPRTMN